MNRVNSPLHVGCSKLGKVVKAIPGPRWEDEEGAEKKKRRGIEKKREGGGKKEGNPLGGIRGGPAAN